MFDKEIIDNFLELIPDGKVMSVNQLAKIFCTDNNTIESLLGNTEKVTKEDNITLDTLWIPKITNYYVSLITNDLHAISYFETISHKIKLLHPTCVIKTPIHYHITLADLSNIHINKELINNIFSETTGLQSFTFHCTLHKPYIDRKKNKVVFWIRIENNPFLLTLHQCIKKYVPRRTDKQFIPHITLGKILGTIEYSEKINGFTLDVDCLFNQICISANIDANKDIILFSKQIA